MRTIETLAEDLAEIDFTGDFNSIQRLRELAKSKWTIEELLHISGYHLGGTFIPDGLNTRVNYSGMTFSSWKEASIYDREMKRLRQEVYLTLGAAAAMSTLDARAVGGLVVDIGDATLLRPLYSLEHEVAKSRAAAESLAKVLTMISQLGGIAVQNGDKLDELKADSKEKDALRKEVKSLRDQQSGLSRKNSELAEKLKATEEEKNRLKSQRASGTTPTC